MDQTIEPKIQPLVDALNALPGVRTGLSSAGQIWPCVSPFVHVDCSLSIAKMIDGKLRAASRNGALNYWWEIGSHFQADGELHFRVRSRPFSFLGILAGRKKIDADLSVLAKIFGNVGDLNKGIGQVVQSHDRSLPFLHCAWNLTRLSVVVMFLTATLTACGTSNVELQQDGTGSDEMLKSPCACLPVPYDPQFYRWDVS